MDKLKFVNSRLETAWGFQLPDGRIIDLMNEKGVFSLHYNRAFDLKTGEVFPEGEHPEGSVTLNDLTKEGGKTVHCYDEVDLNYGVRFRLTQDKLEKIKKFFAKKGFNVTKEAIIHQYNNWNYGFKSGYRDEKNG